MDTTIDELLAIQSPLDLLAAFESDPFLLTSEALSVFATLSKNATEPSQQLHFTGITNIATACLERGITVVRTELERARIKSWDDYRAQSDPDSRNETYAEAGSFDHDDFERAAQFGVRATEIISLFNYQKGIVWASLKGALGLSMILAGNGTNSNWIEAAITNFESALSNITPEVDPWAWAVLQGGLGMAYGNRLAADRTNNIERAIACYEQALQIIQHDTNIDIWATITTNLGIAYRDRLTGEAGSNIEQSLFYLFDVINNTEPEIHYEHWIPAALNLGIALEKKSDVDGSSDWNKAIECLVNVFEAAQSTGDSFNMARANAEIGRIFADRFGDFDAAMRHYKTALKLFDPDGNWVDWMRCQSNLANALLRRKNGFQPANIELAICLLNKIVKLAERTDKNVARFVFSNLGSAYTKRLRGSYAENQERAFAFYQKAFALANTPQEEANSRRDLGVACRNRVRGDRAQNVERSIFHLQQSISCQQLQDCVADPSTYIELAYSYMCRPHRDTQSNVDEAIRCATEALSMLPPEDSQHRLAALNAIGIAYSSMRYQPDHTKHVEAAIRIYQEALALSLAKNDTFWLPQILCNLGAVFLSRREGDPVQNLETAIKHFEQALCKQAGRRDDPGQAVDLLLLAESYLRRKVGDPSENIDRALAYFRQASEVGQTFVAPARQIKRYIAEAQALLGRGRERWADALRCLEKAVSLFDTHWDEAVTSESRTELISEISDAGQWSALIHSASGNYDKALQQLETIRGIVLRESLTIDEIMFEKVVEPDRLRIHELQKRIARLRAEAGLSIGEARPYRAIADDLHKAQNELAETLSNFRQRPGSLQLAELLPAIPEASFFIAPVATRFGGLIFVIPAGVTDILAQHVIDAPELTAAVTYKILEQWIAAYNDAFEHPNASLETEEHGKALSSALEKVLERVGSIIMQPVIERIDALSRQAGQMKITAPELVIMPTGPLSLLPLHAASYTVQGKGRTVIDDYAVSYTPSLHALKASVARRQKNKSSEARNLLALVNPNNNLPFGEIVEIPALRQFFPDAQSNPILFGNAASKEALKVNAHGRHYLHLSCHGRFNHEDPEQAGLELAKGEWLTLREIVAELDLDGCRWVMLSACDTGMMDISRTPEEAIGQVTAFQLAGATCVIASLWRVSDKGAAIFTRKVYEEHLVRNLSPAQAVRQAVLWLRNLSADAVGTLIGYGENGIEPSLRFAEIDDQSETPEGRPLNGPRPFASPLSWAAFTTWGI